MPQSKTDDERQTSEADTAGLEAFNNLLRRMLAMPPKQHRDMKLGKPRRGRQASREAKASAHGEHETEAPPEF